MKTPIIGPLGRLRGKILPRYLTPHAPTIFRGVGCVDSEPPQSAQSTSRAHPALEADGSGHNSEGVRSLIGQEGTDLSNQRCSDARARGTATMTEPGWRVESGGWGAKKGMKSRNEPARKRRPQIPKRTRAQAGPQIPERTCAQAWNSNPGTGPATPKGNQIVSRNEPTFDRMLRSKSLIQHPLRNVPEVAGASAGRILGGGRRSPFRTGRRKAPGAVPDAGFVRRVVSVLFRS